ncbi:BCCT family transporter [Streptomyces sp. NBC_00160]|nr:BCCT family transporter [Streptomyces sp. NBC_00160]MCX5302270.1 BCCT family transporter [Streptomyces sp. NBC_00160]
MAGQLDGLLLGLVDLLDPVRRHVHRPISRGRTVRQFIGGVILVPSTVSLLWFCVFGGTAMKLQERGDLPRESTPEGQLFGS